MDTPVRPIFYHLCYSITTVVHHTLSTPSSALQIRIGDIGDIIKVRLEHDSTGDFPAWHVLGLELRDMDTEQVITFPVNRWLAQDEDDGQTVREMAVDTDMPGVYRKHMYMYPLPVYIDENQ